MFRAMGRRGVSHHARGTEPGLANAGLPYAVLARNRSWTTFAVIGDAGIELLAARIGTPIMQIWSDDDHGSQIKVATPDGWSGEMMVALDDAALSDADKEFLAELAKRGVVTATKHMALLIGLPIHVARRADWLAGDGLEDKIGLPDATPLPSPGSVKEFKLILPKAKFAAGKKLPKPKQPPKATPAAMPAAIDRNVLALHVYYWTEVFQMNGWKLYNRYKKHLPATRRREVDALGNLIMMGAEPAEVETAVEAILSTIWTADDWDAAIRDPRLASDEPLDANQLDEWRRRLG
jgi:hypothetical protein